MYQFVANFSKKRIDYYPFGLKHSGYNSDQLMYIKQGTTTKIVPIPPLFKTSYDVKFQGQKREEDLALNWDSFKWRNYDYATGRFFGIDKLSEKYSYQSPYNFSENRVVDSRELEGLEAIHSTQIDSQGTKSHVLEKNIIVLTRETSREYSDSKNERITTQNNDRISAIKKELSSGYSNAKNSKGETVEFKFNVTGLESKVTDGSNINELQKTATEKGIVSSDKTTINGEDVNKVSKATIITTGYPGANNEGSASRNFLIKPDDALTSVGHEVGHTMETRSAGEEHADGGVLGETKGHVNRAEVDKMLEDSYEK